jgi:hypothetical protein
MPTLIFKNLQLETVLLTIQPSGRSCEVPHLALAGVRYFLNAGAENPCHASISEHQVEYWCDADDLEIDLVLPSQYDKLRWSICTEGGWCGGCLNGEPTTVDDLLPCSGTISSKAFAKLAIRADGWPECKPFRDDHVEWLRLKFEEHLGSSAVDVAILQSNLKNPFE